MPDKANRRMLFVLTVAFGITACGSDGLQSPLGVADAPNFAVGDPNDVYAPVQAGIVNVCIFGGADDPTLTANFSASASPAAGQSILSTFSLTTFPALCVEAWNTSASGPSASVTTTMLASPGTELDRIVVYVTGGPEFGTTLTGVQAATVDVSATEGATLYFKVKPAVTPLPAALGDRVWFDLNRNGIQDEGEVGVAGVTVNLYSGCPAGGTPIATTTTDADGLYLFSGLAAGSYTVGFVRPDGYTSTLANQGSNDEVDSDADAVTGMTGCYTLAAGETNLTVDAGFYVVTAPSGETATGRGTVYPNTSNWFMYTAYTTSKVDLVSGRDHKDVGDIFMSRSGKGASAITTIRIVLHTGWSWDGVPEVLKIHPFDRAPTAYLEPGDFLYKFTAPNEAKHTATSVVFSGNTVTVTLPGHSPRFYGIHGDLVNQ
jgi:hypothetical protein